ncbi:MAG: hypothetical protein IJ815_03110 [Lachnospiraceae bacterium]|nr:hypothetical protein [Lachnospiraceae bacterium]
MEKRMKYKGCSRCDYYKDSIRKKKTGAFFKTLICVIEAHGLVCVSMSYVLAWLEHTQVVEAVSQTIVTEIIAPVIVYGITKTVENIFEKNKLSFSEPLVVSKKTDNEESEVLG